MKEENKNEELVEETIQTVDMEDVKEEIEEKFASLEEEYKLHMEGKVQDAENRVKEAEDKFLRTHADFENIKKRLEREKYQAIDYASEKFAKDMLATIDTLEMALQSANMDAPAEELLPKLKEGIELTLKNLVNSFEKNNVVAVDSDEFDPEHHNAVMQVNSDEHEHGAIVQVLQKGYKLKDRLLRPAMVSICQK
ncbi:MAG: nucleotide exchange factor GrpE [Epsilonproteobacteria bacterium]|nr:nucleotide exchange factor GrpE [Campylobacterota bacterium]